MQSPSLSRLQEETARQNAEGLPDRGRKLEGREAQRNVGPSKGAQKAMVLVVDDNDFVLDAVGEVLRQKGYIVMLCADSREAMGMIRAGGVEAVLTDIRMPNVSGLSLLEKIHEHDGDLPVILMTAYAELHTAITALKSKAFDFIIKPYRPDHLAHAVQKAVKYYRLVKMERNYRTRLEEEVSNRSDELAGALEMVRDMSQELVTRLTVISEYRDDDTGAHIKRMGLYAGTLASELKMPGDFVDDITFAAPMHDIGKIGIPDSILLKPGALTDIEFEFMKLHTVIGERMLVGSTHSKMQKAGIISLCHHEKWDGSGYPRGLKGGDIPVEGRIVNIADQYDALRSRRPYKIPMGHQEACRMLLEGNQRNRPSHFDPDVLGAFKRAAPVLEEIFEKHQDQAR